MSNQKQPEPAAVAGPRVEEIALKVTRWVRATLGKPLACAEYNDYLLAEITAILRPFFPAPSTQPRPELKDVAQEIIRTLRPADPGSWEANTPYVLMRLSQLAAPSTTEDMRPIIAAAIQAISHAHQDPGLGQNLRMQLAAAELELTAIAQKLRGAAPSKDVETPACERCDECTSEALEQLSIIENADSEEGQEAVFQLRKLLPTLDKFIKWEIEDAVAKSASSESRTPDAETLAREIHLLHCGSGIKGSICPCHIVKKGMSEGCDCENEIAEIADILSRRSAEPPCNEVTKSHIDKQED